MFPNSHTVLYFLFPLLFFLSYLQMSDDAEALRLLQAAGGGGGELVRPADQQVTCGGVAAAFGANVRKLRDQRPDRTPAQGCGEENC